MSNRIRVEKELSSRMRTLVLCGLTAFALAAPGMAKDLIMSATAPVDVETNVIAVHQAPAGSALPGLHMEAAIKGRVMDIYISPADFAAKYVPALSKGDYIHIVGSEAKAGDSDVLVAREISTGAVDKKTGTFHENLSIYLWNNAGPLWQ